MNQNSTLYWSTLKVYEDCPQQFLWSRGWDTINLGYGVGNGIPNPNKESKHHAVMGTVIQYAIEKMYNDELYKDPKNLLEVLMSLVDKEFIKQESKPKNNMDYGQAKMSRDQVLQICKYWVTGYLQTMKAHRFLGPYAKAEVDIVGWINKYTPIGGRADTIIRRDDTGITILDGKNSGHKMKYTDPDQLRWYALLFKLAYHKTPDRLGFVWYRFPYGSVTVGEGGQEIKETGVEWIPFDEGDLKGLAQRAIDAKQAMWKEKFDPTPSPTTCKFCDFVNICPARQDQRTANAAKRAPKELVIEGVDIKKGITSFSL